MVVVPKAFISNEQGIISSSNADDHAEKMPGMCIEVVNLSAFALTISEVGVLLNNKKRGVLSKHFLNGGEKLPKRIDPHHSVTVYSLHPKDETMDILRDVSKAYAMTESGIVKKGASPFLRSIVRRAKKMHANRTVNPE